ncbi:hypothetical protein ACIJYD_04320 [Candidatus Pelagibacter bacterium nBUS_33]|jgi:hypothetical protein|uniref:hypothetical protein n=1 Tax=Candidatus Pelagibacter bacterium nBUS_33 TaxID=3374193 RepID=UPI003EBA87B0
MINDKNLILGAAFGYHWNDLKIFIKSLRKFSNCRVILIFEHKLDKKNLDKFKYYKIEHYIYKKKPLKNVPGLINSKSDVGQRRYEMYEFVLKKIKKKPKKVLLTDTRDVVFQDDLFNNKFQKSINFFLEDEKISNDSRNIRWLKRTVGNIKYNKIKNNKISCSGTTFGNFDQILNYSHLMKKYLFIYPYKRPLRHLIIFKKIEPYDQGIHNYLIYNNYFKNMQLHKNGFSKICTTAYMKKFSFNKKGQLRNKKNKIYSLIHQYDRSFDKNGFPIFNFKKLYA